MVVYTAVFGGYDTVRPPVDPGEARWVCVTDGPDAPEPWHTVRLPEWQAGEAQRRARLYKTRSHRWFLDNIVVWIDGNIRLRVAPEELLKYIERADIAAIEHDREHHYSEAAECILAGKGDRERIVAQTKAYLGEECPPLTVWATGLVVRRQTPAVVRLNELWWQQIERYSVRDQIGLPYCLWKLGMPCSPIPGPFTGTDEFDYFEHG